MQTKILAIELIFFLIPSIFTTAKLYIKAGESGWAIFVPVYQMIVYARISNRPLWLGLAIGLLPFIEYIIPDNNARAIVGFIVLVGGIYMLHGFIKQYNGKIFFWITYFFLPIVALFLVNKVDYVVDGIPLNHVDYRDQYMQRYPSYSRPDKLTTTQTPFVGQNAPDISLNNPTNYHPESEGVPNDTPKIQ